MLFSYCSTIPVMGSPAMMSSFGMDSSVSASGISDLDDVVSFAFAFVSDSFLFLFLF